MSYAVGTTHYNLPQTQGTDKRDWSDTNQAFADLDAAVYGAETDSATAVSTANSASSTATSAATDAASAVTTANAASAAATSAGELASLARTEAQTAETNASAAVTTANGASANASAAIAAVGDLTDLDTTDKSSAVAAINELVALIGQIGGGGMPILDFANPLHTFDNTSAVGHGLSYTTSKECYLYGSIRNGATGTAITIDNTPIADTVLGGGSYYESNSFNMSGMIHLKAGSTITVSEECPLLYALDVVSAS